MPNNTSTQIVVSYIVIKCSFLDPQQTLEDHTALTFVVKSCGLRNRPVYIVRVQVRYSLRRTSVAEKMAPGPKSRNERGRCNIYRSNWRKPRYNSSPPSTGMRDHHSFNPFRREARATHFNSEDGGSLLLRNVRILH
jgi:hypothetical protein